MKSFFAADDFAQVAELVGVVGLDNVVDAAGVAVVLKKKLVKSLQAIAYSPQFPRFSQK